jgi:transcriptional regulator with XRE-family HTH domain
MTVRSGVVRPSSVFRATERYRHDAKAIGENVRRVRHRKGLTLEQAASRMEGDFRHFQRIEAGKVNLTLATMLRRIGQQVSSLRHQRGLSSTGLARLAGISMLLLQDVERGQYIDLTVYQLVQLGLALGVTEETLLARSTEDSPSTPPPAPSAPG